MVTGELIPDLSLILLLTSFDSFIYADERNADGSMKGMSLDGEAHAQFFADLANGKEEVPWHATFVKGKGYVTF